MSHSKCLNQIPPVTTQMCKVNKVSIPSTSSPLSLGSLQHWSTDGIPDLHIIKIHGHNFQWLNYQKDEISSLTGKEEREKKWSCLASVFLTDWMTCSHDSFLAGSLLLGYGCCRLKAWGWIQEHLMNTEHRRGRRRTLQSAGTVLPLPDWPYSSLGRSAAALCSLHTSPCF